MLYPDFFDRIEPITLYDPLTRLLGINQDGLLAFSYLDVVKLAGHSCPTTAGAFLMLKRALGELYPNQLPFRGDMTVEFKENAHHGTTGVTAAIASLITGASDEKGFKGLGGRYARNNRLFFERPIPMQMRVTRRDSETFVDIDYHPARLQEDPLLASLKQKVLGNVATEDEQKRFGRLWQERVREIVLEYGEKSELLSISKGP